MDNIDRAHKYTTEEEINLLKEEIIEAKANGLKKTVSITRIFSFLIFVVVLLFLSIVFTSVLISKYKGEVPQVFGYQLYRVQTGSMSPTLPIGSIILSKRPENSASLEVDDIVTFEQGGKIITHRIIEVIEKNNVIRYRTKGDNPNNSPDIELLSPKSVKAIFLVKIF